MLPSMLRWALILSFALAAPALAQPQELRLDNSGAWHAAEQKPLDPDAATIARARELLADNKPRQAKAVLSDWLDKHATGDHPLLAQAYLLRGDARTADGNEYKA